MPLLSLSTINVITLVWMGIAVAVHVTMFLVTAPFGRHTSTKWGPTIDNRVAWAIMEAPSFLIMASFLMFGSRSFSSFVWILFALWIVHYGNRALVWPLRIRTKSKRMPLVIVANAVVFNVMNAGLNGYFLAELSDPGVYSGAWLASFQFLLGAMLFVAGFAVNLSSDNTLIALRKPGETNYAIPSGALFDRVASPNLFGEVIEWIGFAIMAWNLQALSFAVWTYANLVPRAKNHLDWYRRTFPDYPKNRKAIFPWIF